MEMLRISNKDNIVNSYGIRPTLPYDVEGVLVEKKGKDIRIEKTIDNKTIEYSLRVNKEVLEDLGDNIKIEKEDIISSKVEEKEEVKEVEEHETRKVADIISELGLEYTEENIRMIEHLLSSGITITKENISSYIKSREYLKKIIEGIDTNSFVKLMDRGINLEGENLQKIAQALEEVKNEKTPFSIKRFLRLEKDLTYKEAEEIAKEIYGQKMGKDVYDTIIALNKEKLPITKENIDKTMEVISKLHNLKGIKDEIYVKILNEDKIFNIDNLYKLSNSYTLTTIGNNEEAKTFESFTIGKETTLDSMKEVLVGLDIEDSMENINILREFVVNDMLMDKKSYNKIISMKESVKELLDLLGHGEIGVLNANNIDPLQEDIYKLVEELKKDKLTIVVDEPSRNEKIEEIMKDLESLGSIKDKDLLQIIKSGEDFNLKSIREIIDTNIQKELNIEHKTLDRTIYISNILNTLGESLNTNIISFAARRYNGITLENLYSSHEEIITTQVDIVPVDKIQEGLIYDEYIRARNNLTTNMIKESIKDGKAIEQMPINELNNYMEKKINRYKETDRLTKEIRDIKGHEERILPIIMKNGLPMTIKEIKDINSFLNGEKGLVNLLKDIIDTNNPKYNEEFKEGIKLLQDKISIGIKNGDEALKDNYKELVNSLNSQNSSYNENDDEQRDKGKEEYIEIQRKISQKDMVFQLPIEIGNEYKNLNIIIPDSHQNIDKNNMKFYISLETENLGPVTMDISIKGKEVQIDLKEEKKILGSSFSVLEEGLQKIGYTLSKQINSVTL